MKPISPVIPNENHGEIIIAEHQDEYQNLPAIRLHDQSIVTRWKLTDEEKAIVAETGDIYLIMRTFGKPVTPVLLQVEIPNIEPQLTHYVSSRLTPELRDKLSMFKIESLSKPCAGCGAEVAITSRDVEIIDMQNLPLICTICAEGVDFKQRVWSPEAVSKM